MTFEMNRNGYAANNVRKKISKSEETIRYTRKTTRIHQNNKKLKKLKERLEYVIYQENKLDLFNYLEKEITARLESELTKQFDGFASIKNLSLE